MQRYMISGKMAVRYIEKAKAATTTYRDFGFCGRAAFYINSRKATLITI